MGAAAFIVLVFCAMVVIGFIIYGVYVGLATLARQTSRMWMQIVTLGEGTAALVPVEDAEAAQPARREGGPRCWEVKGCAKGAREGCPAYLRPDLPCWLANMKSTADYRLNPNCLTCRLFNIPALMTHA